MITSDGKCITEIKKRIATAKDAFQKLSLILRGKQRITILDSLCNSATGGQSKGLNFLKLSDDRDVWRGMAANVCSRSGT